MPVRRHPQHKTDMKHHHPIGKPFKMTSANGVSVTLVAVECETIVDKNGIIYRKTCKGCYFAKLKSGWCSGHQYFDTVCRQIDSKRAKCAPEYRDDNKMIHYKQIVKK